MNTIKAISIAAALTAVAACSGPLPEASGLAERLMAAADAGTYMYAHQDDLSYGHSWTPESDDCVRSDVRDVCGDYPAIVGFDLGGIELGDSANLDGVDFDYMRKAASAHADRGGIVTFSWHLRNPLTGGDAWDISSDRVVASVLEGGDFHDEFMVWLDRLADFLESVKDSEGRQVPCIFRPWHENTGSWFWWGADLCTADEYKALWAMTYDFLVTGRGLDGMVWAYSPSSTDLRSRAMERYPGDDIIDLIGVDRYDSMGGTEVHEDFVRGMRGDLEYLQGIAAEHGLILAVTETGQEGISCPVWWTGAVQTAVEGFPVAYVLTWRNAHDRPTHFFGPWKGADCEDDFKAFHDSDKTLFLEDID